MIEYAEVRRRALEEIGDENFRAAVDTEKARIRAHRPFWHRVFPWVITITRRSK